MFTTFFSETKPVDWNTVKAAVKIRFGKFFQKMMGNDAYLAPSQFESGFVSTMRTNAIIDKTIAAAVGAFHTIGEIHG